MGIVISMECKNNSPGAKKYYCWEGDVLGLAVIDKWQEVILGYYVYDQNDSFWGIGIKRNTETEGRSAFYYQVLTPYLAKIFLNDIEKHVTVPQHRKILRKIGLVLSGKIELTTVHELLEEIT